MQASTVIQAAFDRQNMSSSFNNFTRQATSAYYPSSGSIDNAKRVHVDVGRDVSSIDVTLPLNPPIIDPARRPPQPPGAPTGTGRVAGRITDATSGRPIKNALLVISSTDGMQFGDFALTDARGRFAFTNLAPRKYRLRAEAERYFALVYGETRPGSGGGTSIEVADGQDVGIDMSLPPVPRGSAVEGIITDEFGDPAPGIDVEVARKQYAAGRQRLMVHGGMYLSDRRYGTLPHHWTGSRRLLRHRARRRVRRSGRHGRICTHVTYPVRATPGQARRYRSQPARTASTSPSRSFLPRQSPSAASW